MKQDGGLQAKTVWEELNRRDAGRFGAGQLRTLQRWFLARTAQFSVFHLIQKADILLAWPLIIPRIRPLTW